MRGTAPAPAHPECPGPACLVRESAFGASQRPFTASEHPQADAIVFQIQSLRGRFRV